uniref:Uncharacterized protein n=1 Tax=viral metagenome TaxID=1070528 RepID=A0A6C0I4M0_9ZZZZ
MSMSIFPTERLEKTLANGKTVSVCRYSDERIIHCHVDGQILVWWNGYDRPCHQYVDEASYTRDYVSRREKSGFRYDAFIGQIDPETHEFGGSVVSVWPTSFDIVESEPDTFVYVLRYSSGRVVHIDELGKVFDWPHGYLGLCSEYTDVETYNNYPSMDVFTGIIDSNTHLRQGFGMRRYFNDPDAVSMPNGWLNRRHESLPYMFIGNFVDGEVAGEGTMIYINNLVVSGTFDKWGMRKAHPVNLETMRGGQADPVNLETIRGDQAHPFNLETIRGGQVTRANTVNILSCPSVILPLTIQYDSFKDAGILKYTDRVLTISENGKRTVRKMMRSIRK